MEAGFLRFVWRHSWRWQLSILAITIAVFPLVYLSLELPKIIINDAIHGDDGPRALLGFEIGRLAWLLTMCCALLALIGKIRIDEVVANVEFGGPKRNRLFICATTSLRAVYLNTAGAAPRFG